MPSASLSPPLLYKVVGGSRYFDTSSPEQVFKVLYLRNLKTFMSQSQKEGLQNVRTTIPKAEGNSVPQYIPAPYLYDGSLLTASQLTSHFQDFYANLEHISCTPSFVFERLVANLNGTFIATLERERVQHATVVEKERLEHAAALEQVRLDNTVALEQERLRHTTALENEKKALELNEQLKQELLALKKTTSNPTIGNFYIHDVRHPGTPGDKASKTIFLAKPYSAPPHLPIGINMLDITTAEQVRVNASVCDVLKNRFNVNIDTYGGTIVRDAGCTWLELDANDPDFQSGFYRTTEDYPWNEHQKHYIRFVTFAHAYSKTPRVVVWLTGLEMNKDLPWRVKLYATDITTTGFTLHIDTWGNSILYCATASWVAYPSDRSNIFSGRFSTIDVRRTDSPQLFNSAYESFGNNVFSAPPRVFLAINSFEIGCQKNLRIMAKASDINTTGMTWHLDSWSDTVLYSAGASYIALG